MSSNVHHPIKSSGDLVASMTSEVPPMHRLWGTRKQSLKALSVPTLNVLLVSLVTLWTPVTPVTPSRILLQKTAKKAATNNILPNYTYFLGSTFRFCAGCRITETHSKKCSKVTLEPKPMPSLL
eukprot:GHVQ01040123.1.p1 GENE.GHVQ01040123.1~~GHVQ01040123.1.p1  ORF type:complete len:124 (-),score=4.90 GHVQ01040123.1:356-727(-)